MTPNDIDTIELHTSAGMKQIIFKNQVYKIESCFECPILNEDYGFCQDGACIKHPIVEGIFPKDCALEDYEEDISQRAIRELMRLGCSEDVARNAVKEVMSMVTK